MYVQASLFFLRSFFFGFVLAVHVPTSQFKVFLTFSVYQKHCAEIQQRTDQFRQVYPACDVTNFSVKQDIITKWQMTGSSFAKIGAVNVVVIKSSFVYLDYLRKLVSCQKVRIPEKNVNIIQFLFSSLKPCRNTHLHPLLFQELINRYPVGFESY